MGRGVEDMKPKNDDETNPDPGYNEGRRGEVSGSIDDRDVEVVVKTETVVRPPMGDFTLTHRARRSGQKDGPQGHSGGNWRGWEGCHWYILELGSLMAVWS